MSALGNSTQLIQLHKILGGTINNGWVNIPGPTHSPSDRSLGVKPSSASVHGFCIHSFAGDDPALCIQHVKALLDSNASILNAVSMTSANNVPNKKAKIEIACQIWNCSVPIEDTLATTYLESRNCLASHVAESQALRYSPVGRFKCNEAPALYGAMSDAVDGKFCGIHRTALRYDGKGKAFFSDGTPSKMMLGIARNSVVKLGPFEPVLGIAEGIETALSAMLLFNLPVWAAMSAGGISNFPALSNIKHLMIFADNDTAGHVAALRCAQRYSQAGILGHIRFPHEKFNDWNDYLVSKS